MLTLTLTLIQVGIEEVEEHGTTPAMFDVLANVEERLGIVAFQFVHD